MEITVDIILELLQERHKKQNIESITNLTKVCWVLALLIYTKGKA